MLWPATSRLAKSLNVGAGSSWRCYLAFMGFFGRYLDNQVTRHNVVENFRDQVTC